MQILKMSEWVISLEIVKFESESVYTVSSNHKARFKELGDLSSWLSKQVFDRAIGECGLNLFYKLCNDTGVRHTQQTVCIQFRGLFSIEFCF